MAEGSFGRADFVPMSQSNVLLHQAVVCMVSDDTPLLDEALQSRPAYRGYILLVELFSIVYPLKNHECCLEIAL